MPRKPQVVPAPAAPADFDFSASHQRFNDIELFARFCRAYPTPEGAITYVYRLSPVIDREQLNSRDTSIEKVTGAVVDADYLLSKWGSGKYLLLFNDSNRPQSAQQVAKCTVEVNDPTLPPMVDPGELVVSHPDNRAIVNRYLNQGWTVKQSSNQLKPNGFEQLTPPAAPASAETVAVQTLSELARGASAQLPAGAVVIDRDMLRELLANRRAGGDDLERAFAIADRLKPADTSGKLLDRAIDALMRRPEPAAAPAPAASSGVETLRATMQFLRDEMGWQPAAGGSGGGSLVPSGVWGMLGNALSQLAMGFGQALAMRYMAPVPGVSASANEFSTGGSVVSGGSPTPIASSPLSAPNPMEESSSVMNPAKIQQLIALGKAAIAAFQSGQSGDEFAEQFSQSSPANDALYTDLLEMGRDEILGYVGMMPGAAELVGPRRAEIEAWLDDFLAYGAPEEGESVPPAA